MDRQYTKWLIGGVVWIGYNAGLSIRVVGVRVHSSPQREKNKFNYYKTYENIETKTLNVYVSIEQLVFEFFQ